jgi:RNA polymerase sigma factor (sigma-70 family)
VVWGAVTDQDDVRLLEAWQAGDRASGDLLMRAYYGQILGFFRLRVPAVAEDLTQRTLLACAEGRERVHSSSVRAFLFGIARNMLLKHLEAQRRQVELADVGAGRPQSILSPSGVIAQRREHWLLLRALERLPDDTQLVIALHYVQGLKSREIGDVLGVGTSTVTTRLSRAREALRTEVEGLRAPAPVRASLLADLEMWARSLGPLVHGAADPR